jgi:hypothetical protein
MHTADVTLKHQIPEVRFREYLAAAERERAILIALEAQRLRRACGAGARVAALSTAPSRSDHRKDPGRNDDAHGGR